ncbi:hypothetical protein NE237_001207 [Protea cynaroides]|uniref:Uncharacterized protein n=1 Tax=Protea cynaroides TaxID=273540 RepID=A0A9Q0KTP9_9MAGN|nr:hypothetical protein NE237_001207 [Protea cynaroides]
MWFLPLSAQTDAATSIATSPMKIRQYRIPSREECSKDFITTPLDFIAVALIDFQFAIRLAVTGKMTVVKRRPAKLPQGTGGRVYLHFPLCLSRSCCCHDRQCPFSLSLPTSFITESST